jgi:hypothetical protein
MGIWTRPLFVTSPDIVVRTADIPEPTLTLLKDQIPYGDIFLQESFTLQNLMDSIHDMAKIWGYFDVSLLTAWVKFMKFIRSKNPDAPIIQFHFFCRDEDIPFYFECRQDGSCWFFQYSPEQFLEHFSQKEYYPNVDEGNDTEPDDEEPTPEPTPEPDDDEEENHIEPEAAEEYEIVFNLQAYTEKYKYIFPEISCPEGRSNNMEDIIKLRSRNIWNLI